MKLSTGFTLIELLVVITIIVVLLALLVPAMDKAIYQAEMTVCGATQGGIAKGVSIYAMDSKRYYPHRPGVTDPDATGYWASFIRDPRKNGADDLRRTLNGYLTAKQFLDPMVPTVDLSYDGTLGTNLIIGSYQLWFGWQYHQTEDVAAGVGGTTTRNRGMFKVGDKWTYRDRAGSFDLLTSDDDYYTNNPSAPRCFGSHPDRDGLMAATKWENFGDAAGGDPQASAAAMGQGMNYPQLSLTWSRYDSAPIFSIKRGAVDRNFSYADGHVARIDNITLDAGLMEPDDRMTWVSMFSAGFGGDRQIVPKP